MADALPPITPASTQPKLEAREEIKSARIQDVVGARREVRQVRLDATQRWNDPRDPYTRGDAASDYLAALKDLIMELETFYLRLGGREAYWDPDVGNPVMVLQRPGLAVKQLFEPNGALPATGGYPRVLNRDALEPQVVQTISCLPELLELESAQPTIPVTLRVQRGRQTETETHGVSLVIPMADLDRARRMCLDYAEEIGLSVATNDERDRGRMGGRERYGEE